MSDWQRFLDAVEQVGLPYHRKCVVIGEAHRVVEAANKEFNKEFNRWFRQAATFQEQRDKAIRERDTQRQRAENAEDLAIKLGSLKDQRTFERDEAQRQHAVAVEAARELFDTAFEGTERSRAYFLDRYRELFLWLQEKER
jgi:hypothetical protein